MTCRSTIVRSLVRTPFRLLEHTAPGLGARAADALWLRMPSGRPRPAEAGGTLELLGSPFEVALDGRAVRGWSWGAGPVVYLVHGWGGTLEQLVPFAGALAAAGYRVVAHDGPSHGHSDPGAMGPRRSDGVELARSLGAVADRFGPAHAVVAHSLGALSTLLALREGWLEAGRLALLAPASGVPAFLASAQRQLGIGPRTARRLAERTHRRTGYRVEEVDAARLGAAVGHAPALFVAHDERDREMPHAASAALVAGWPGAALLTTTGLGHRRLLADPAVVDAVTGFVDRPLPRHAPRPTAQGGRDVPVPLPPAASR